MEEKKLLRDDSNKIIAGVCSGIAKYFGWDATLVRIAWIILCGLGGCGLLAYLIAAILMTPKSN